VNDQYHFQIRFCRLFLIVNYYPEIMRAVAQIKNLTSDTCKHTIVRNLSRILDIHILDIDTENQSLSFLYQNSPAFEKAKRELHRIGFPISQCTYQEPKIRIESIDYLENTI